MKLKNTNILILSLLTMTFPYVVAAETDCFHETQSLLSIILCLDQKGIDNTKAITKAVDKHNSEIKTLTDKLTTLAKKQNEEIVVLKKELVKLNTQLEERLAKEIANQSRQLTTLAGKHDSEIKTLNDKLRQVTYFAQKQSEEIVVLKKQSSNLKQQLVDLNQALKELKAQVVHFRQPFELDSFRVKAIKLK